MTKTQCLDIVLYMSLLLAISCKPMAKFAVADHGQVAPTMINFSNLSKNATYYHWDFGDGQSTVDLHPTHTYLASGNYDIVLTAIKGKDKIVTKQSVTIAAPRSCTVVMQTNLGDIVIELYDQTPAHRDNFVKLVENGYYDGLLFHRVIKGFMAQGGDPDSKHAQASKRIGGGGPGYTIPAEIQDTLVHTRGALAAARAGDDTNPLKASSGSQFYLVDGRQLTATQIEDYAYQKDIKYTPYALQRYISLGGSPQLDREYTVFGKVVRGIEIVDAITNQKVDDNDRPLEDVRILKAILVK
jgi:cyclophilin family peptidyl-prolyl cis-trans isomerase